MRDVLDMRYNGQCFLISDRTRDMLQSEGVTGWRTYPIKLYSKKNEEIDGYNGFTITGRGGKMIKLRENIPYNEDNKYIIWDSNDWDGSDLFRIWPNCVVCTERVMHLFKNNRVEALYFRPLSSLLSIR